MFKRLAVLLVLVLSLAIPLVGCGGGATGSGSGETEEEQRSEQLEVVGDIDLQMEYEYPTCRGVIKNNSGEDLDYVEITFTFYNEDDVQIGTALANTENLKADKQWQFEAIGDTSDGQTPDHYEYEISSSVY